MQMKAPAGFASVSVGGATFNVSDGHITLPDHFSHEGIAALVREGFAPVIETETPAEAAVLATLDHQAEAQIVAETPIAAAAAE